MQILNTNDLFNISGGSRVYAAGGLRLVEVFLHCLSKWFR